MKKAVSKPHPPLIRVWVGRENFVAFSKLTLDQKWKIKVALKEAFFKEMSALGADVSRSNRRKQGA